MLTLAVTLLAPLPTASAQPSGFDLQAHRGGRGETTEESLRAFGKSLELGVSTLELDISDHQGRATSGVARPDDSSPRSAPTPRPRSPATRQYPYVGKLVHELTLVQIRTLDCGTPARRVSARRSGAGQQDSDVAGSLCARRLISGFDPVRYNIETKVEADKPSRSAGPQEFVDVILAAVRSAGKVDRVEIQSFDWRTLPMVHQAEPSIPLVALYNEETWVPDSPWLAGENAAAIGDPMIGAMLVGANILSPDYQLVTGKTYVDHAHSLGLKVIPWTVNDADAMREQIAYGVDGIITDYPTLLRGVLAELGMPLPPAYRRG